MAALRGGSVIAGVISKMLASALAPGDLNSQRGRAATEKGTGGSREAVSHLHGTDAHRFLGSPQGLAEGKGAIGPAPSWRRKEKLRILVRAPPTTQFGDHGRSDGHVTVLASFAIADVQAGW